NRRPVKAKPPKAVAPQIRIYRSDLGKYLSPHTRGASSMGSYHLTTQIFSKNFRFFYSPLSRLFSCLQPALPMIKYRKNMQVHILYL
ncbi:MAG: hypothetical protein MR473_10125, partial [Clostridiales bacterium]|nr:hypothetical protein [Clostridiales bacterium]